MLYLAVCYRPGRSGLINYYGEIIEVSDQYEAFVDQEWFNIDEIEEGAVWFDEMKERYQPNFNGKYDWYESKWHIYRNREDAEEFLSYYCGE